MSVMYILLGALLFLAVVLLITLPILKMVRRRQDRRDAVVDEDWVAPPIDGPLPPMTPKRSNAPTPTPPIATPPTATPPTPTPPVATPPVATPPIATPPVTPPTSTPPSSP